MSTHYVKATEEVTLFNGSIALTIDDRIALTQSQFNTSDVQTAITNGSLVELTAEEAALFKGNYTVIKSDKQLIKGENVSVDTKLGIVHVTLYPNPKPGYSHYILPVDNTWGPDPKFVARIHSDKPIMTDTEYYDLDASVPIFFLYVGGSIGWQVIPS